MRFLTSAAILCLSWSLAIQAELVILRGGDVLKADDFELMDDTVRLSLAKGGSMTLPLLRVERIIDDEILPEAELVEPPASTLHLAWRADAEVPATPYGELIHATAKFHDINSELLAAMVRHESAFDALALSPRGARGLMQIMPATAERFGVSRHNLHDPEKNLEAGARYVAWLFEHFENELPLVLAAFNAGEGTVARFNGVPPYRETQDYLRRIYAELGMDPADL